MKGSTKFTIDQKNIINLLSTPSENIVFKNEELLSPCGLIHNAKSNKDQRKNRIDINKKTFDLIDSLFFKKRKKPKTRDATAVGICE